METCDYPRVSHIIAPLRNPMGWTPELALERGRLVHKACAILDGWGDGSGLDLDSLHPVLQPYVAAYDNFLQTFRPTYIAIEQEVIYHKYKYQGRVDRITDDMILEIKCGDPHPLYGLQLAAYMAAFSRKQRRRLSVHLYPNGRFTVHKWTDRGDWPAFLSCLNLYYWRLKHGLDAKGRERSDGGS